MSETCPPGRKQFLAKPYSVRRVMKAHVIKKTMEEDWSDEDEIDWDVQTASALDWWNQTVKEANVAGWKEEEELAEAIIEKLLKQDVWGDILREEERMQRTVTLFPRTKR